MMRLGERRIGFELRDQPIIGMSLAQSIHV